MRAQPLAAGDTDLYGKRALRGLWREAWRVYRGTWLGFQYLILAVTSCNEQIDHNALFHLDASFVHGNASVKIKHDSVSHKYIYIYLYICVCLSF